MSSEREKGERGRERKGKEGRREKEREEISLGKMFEKCVNACARQRLSEREQTRESDTEKKERKKERKKVSNPRMSARRNRINIDPHLMKAKTGVLLLFLRLSHI